MRRSIAAVALLLVVLAVSPSFAQSTHAKTVAHTGRTDPDQGARESLGEIHVLVGLPQGSGTSTATVTPPSGGCRGRCRSGRPPLGLLSPGGRRSPSSGPSSLPFRHSIAPRSPCASAKMCSSVGIAARRSPTHGALSRRPTSWPRRPTTLPRQAVAATTGRYQLSTDAWGAYPEAVEAHLGDRVDYAQQVKEFGKVGGEEGRRYAPPRLIGSEKFWISGQPDQESVGTSRMERANWTIRTHLRRFTGLWDGLAGRRQTCAPRSLCFSPTTIL